MNISFGMGKNYFHSLASFMISPAVSLIGATQSKAGENTSLLRQWGLKLRVQNNMGSRDDVVGVATFLTVRGSNLSRG